MQSYTDHVNYWRHIVRQKSNILTSKNIFKTLSIDIGDYSGHFSTLDKAVVQLKIAKSDHKVAKTTMIQLRKDFLNEYIARLSKDFKVTPKDMKKILQREEKARSCLIRWSSGCS